MVANDNSLSIYSIGIIHISTPYSFKLKDTLYVSNLKAILLSVSCFVHDNNYVIYFNSNIFFYKGLMLKFFNF